MDLPDELIDYMLDYSTTLPRHGSISFSFNRVSMERYKNLLIYMDNLYQEYNQDPTVAMYQMNRAALNKDWDVVFEIIHSYQSSNRIGVLLYALELYHNNHKYDDADRVFTLLYDEYQRYIFNSSFISLQIVHYLYKLYPSDRNIEYLRDILHLITATNNGYISSEMKHDILYIIKNDTNEYNPHYIHWIKYVLDINNKGDEMPDILFEGDNMGLYLKNHPSATYEDTLVDIDLNIVDTNSIMTILIELIYIPVLTSAGLERILYILSTYGSFNLIDINALYKHINPIVIEYSRDYWNGISRGSLEDSINRAYKLAILYALNTAPII